MATKAEKQAAKEEAKAEKAAAKAEAKAEKAAVKAERSELARIAAAQKAEIVALRSEGVKGKALSAEKKANTAEYNNAQDMFSAAGRQTLMTAGQPTFFSNAATYSGQTANNVNQRLQTAASKYDTLGITDLSMAGRTKVGLGLDKIVQYDLGKAGNTATTTIQRAERFVGKAFSPEELKAEGIKVKEVKGVPGLFRYRTGEEGNSIYTFFRKDAEGNFVGTGVNRTATPQDDGGFFGSDLGQALMIAGSIALSLTPGGQAFAASIGSALSGGALTGLSAQALGSAVVRGVSTGLITGDVEKGLIAGAISGAGSALNLSGELGNVFDSVGLGDYKDAFGVIGGQASQASMAAADAVSQAAQGLGADQIASNLVAAGIDPAIAQNAASLALQGGTTSAITSALNSQGAGGVSLADLGIQEAGEEAVTPVSNMLTQGEAANLGMLDGGGATVPSAFDQAVESALGGGSNLGQFGNINTLGFGDALPTTDALTQSLIAAGLSPGTAANLAGATLAGVGAAGGSAIGSAIGSSIGGTAAGTAAGAAAGSSLLNSVAQGAGSTLGNMFGQSLFGQGGTLQNLLNAGIDFATASKIASDLEARAGQIQQKAEAAGRAAQVPFTPYTVTTGMGTTTLGPTGATMTATPAYQQLQQTALQQAQSAVSAINPAQAAQTLYGQIEALAAPGRIREQETLLSNLQRRGLSGFGQNLPTVGGGVAGVNPYLESLLSAQETARARQALESQQFGTQEATRQQQLAAGLQTQAQNVDIQQLNQLARAQGLSQDQINLALKNAEAQRLSSLFGLQQAAPLYLNAASVQAGQTSGLGTQAQNLFGNLFTQQVPSIYNNPNYVGGEGTGYIFGNQDYGQYF